MNNKGQFSIIAALLVAVVLVAAVATTYSGMRYGSPEKQPQILSAIDETNLGLKEILGFTVGYYGSVLKVTGNMTYAQQLSTNYLKSGLNNMGDVHPEWGAIFNLTNLDLAASWFTNNSYSQGKLNVNYNLTGLGIYGISYATSTRLNVQIQKSSESSQAQLIILRDEGEPMINLGKSDLKFYSYNYQISTWNLTAPSKIASYANGTYILDLPQNMTSSAYVIQVEDTRGLMVLASSYTQFVTTMLWNSTAYREGVDYIDEANQEVVGTHSNFPAQQDAPNEEYDTLTEGVLGTFDTNNYPTNWSPIGSTNIVGGDLTDLQSDNAEYMQLESYPTAFSSSYNTIGVDSQNSVVLTNQANSMSWSHTTGIAGSDKILLVSIDIFRSNNNPTTITSITYDGMTFTQLASDLYNSNPRVRSYVFYILNPSPGTKTIDVHFASSTYAIGGSLTYTNVNQTLPFLAINTSTGSSSAASVGVSASGSNTKVLFGHLGCYRTNNYFVTDAQTTHWSENSQQYKGFGSDKTVTNGSVSTSWTASSTASWVAIGALLQPTQIGTSFSCSAEFTGVSNIDVWNNLTWTIAASTNVNGIGVTYQLYNYNIGNYVIVDDGFLNDTLGISDSSKSQTISTAYMNFRDLAGNWRIKVNATAATTAPFYLKFDLVRYSINENNYGLNLEEQWLNINSTILRQALCIKTGSLGSEQLLVQVFHGGSWSTVMRLVPNYFNNVSLAGYIDTSTLTIRLFGGNETNDIIPDSYQIDCIYLKDEPDISYLASHQQSSFTLEMLQNGTMRWLGQNMDATTQTIPIPPIPVKAIHVNQTIGDVNQEVPFQIEDWASSYQIPLGLTSNTTVFSNRQILVFILDRQVTDFTVWWDGRDNATQTSMGYTNRYFTADNPSASTLSNGNVTLQFNNGAIKSTVSGTTTYSTATFMRINGEASTYGAGFSYVIHHGIVRDIVQEEAEFNTGAPNCPNVYANIIVTLPANTNYYTYQLRLMFTATSQQRSLTDLNPIKLVPNPTAVQTQTENGTLIGFPIVENGTGTFSNLAVSGWTEHHFSQFISGTGKGSGIMFRSIQNQKLYSFDSIAPQHTGALKATVGSPLIEFLPVTLTQATFNYAYDVTWVGAVATFDGSTPICSLYENTTPMGLWILAEYPPTLSLIPKN